MDLMIVKDVMLGKNDQTILTGPLLLKGFALRSEIEEAFGKQVFVSNDLGERLCVPVNGVSVSQAMGGNWQVSIAVNYSDKNGSVAFDCIVTDED
jgi:hypothetical protein